MQSYTWEVEAEVQLQASLGCMMKPCLKNKKQTKIPKLNKIGSIASPL